MENDSPDLSHILQIKVPKCKTRSEMGLTLLNTLQAKDGKILYGSYWEHLKSGWAKRDHPNMKFIWFEDMGSVQQSRLSSQFAFHCCNLQQLLNTQKNVPFHLSFAFKSFKWGVTAHQI